MVCEPGKSYASFTTESLPEGRVVDEGSFYYFNIPDDLDRSQWIVMDLVEPCTIPPGLERYRYVGFAANTKTLNIVVGSFQFIAG